MDDELYLRRQFLLSPQPVEIAPGWKNIKIGSNYFVTCHPELEVTQIEKDHQSLTLLGFMIDSEESHLTDIQILQRLSAFQESPLELSKATRSLGGRWILIASGDEGTFIFADATGLRQISYTADVSNPMFCGSQPTILSKVLDLSIDEDAKAFLESPEIQGMVEHWWPYDTTLYKEVKHLIPNHYIDIENHTITRFWPNRPLPRLSYREAIYSTGKRLRNLMEGASKRYKLAFPITAGWDSRVILAASKNVASEFFFYTIMLPGMHSSHPDLTIPASLLGKLGFKHHIISCPEEMTEEFANIYSGNVSTAHEEWGPINQGLLAQFPQDHIAIKGTASEIARRFMHRRVRYDEPILASTLAKITKMKKQPFAIKHFGRWLEDAQHAELFDVDLLDLFYYEQRHGNWQAMSQLEFDISHETFTPFSCRALLEEMLGVHYKYRTDPYLTFYRSLIIYLWPDVLQETIYPLHDPVFSKRVKEILRHFLRQLNLLRPIRDFKRTICNLLGLDN